MTESHRPTFLLLEDSALDAELVSEQLRSAGIDCEILLSDTEESFRQALDQSIDLVLSDHNLTSFDSRRALALARDRHPDVPFIVVSGTIGEEAAIDALRNGATDYVLKSRLSRLVPCVQRALDEAERRRQRQQVERALRASEERYLAFLDATTDMVWAVDGAGRITASNAAATPMTGLSVDELLGQAFVQFVPASDDARAMVVAALAGGPAVGVLRHKWQHRDGKARVFETNITPLVDEHGARAGARGITRDITERLRLEEQFRQAQRMEAIGTLAGGIAHDFNNALTTIFGFAELLALSLSPDDARQEDLAAISKAAEYSATLTRQLLAFSRRQVLAPSRLDLRVVVQDLERMLRRVIGEDVQLDVAAPESLPLVLADRGQIEQVLMNLAGNARDAMPNGGKLFVTVEPRDVGDGELPFVVPGSYVRLVVRDTGSGMSVEVASHIFEPFYTTKAKGHGTGLGLSTVYGIVKQSDGYILVDTAPGAGTAFSVYLPIVAAEESAGEPSGAPQPKPPRLLGRETILLVEDEQAVRNLMEHALVRRGYHVVAVSSAEEARERLARGGVQIDLLLTDAVLGGESGPELAAALRAQLPALKIIFMSGYIEQTPVRARLMTEGSAFLQKPFGPRVLVERVREVLDR